MVCESPKGLIGMMHSDLSSILLSQDFLKGIQSGGDMDYLDQGEDEERCLDM